MTMRERREDYDRLVHNRRIDMEKSRTAASIDRLFRLSRDDAVVNAHLTAWREGLCGSLEEMLCQLVLRLATSNKELREQVVTLMQTGCFPRTIELNEESDRET